MIHEFQAVLLSVASCYAAPAADDGGGAAGDDGAPAGGDGEVKAASVRPVSVANQTQCCGGLKSGVCTLI